MSTKQNQRSEPRRVRLSIPMADRVVQEWLDAQDDRSLSFRLLVRAEVERNGIQDVACRPVVQQPRRGRPPMHELVGLDDNQDAPEPAEPAEPETKPEQPAHKVDRQARAPKPAPAPEPEPVTEPGLQTQADDDGQVDVNDILSTLRS